MQDFQFPGFPRQGKKTEWERGANKRRLASSFETRCLSLGSSSVVYREGQDASPSPPPPPPGGPPPPPTFSQANTTPPKLSRDEAKGRGALLSDICKGARLKKVAVVNDRSAPVLEKPKGGGSSGGGGVSGAMQPMGGLFQGGVPKLRSVADGSVGKSALHPPGSRPAAPRPPTSAAASSGSGGHGDGDSSSLRAPSPEVSRSHRPSLPDLSLPSGGGGSSAGMKHSSSAPPPPPPVSRRANTPPTSHPKAGGHSYNREKPLPPTPGQRGSSPMSTRENAPPPPVKPPPFPLNLPRPSPGGLFIVLLLAGPSPGPLPPAGPYRAKPPPPPSRTPAGPPPPPPIRNGHTSISKSFVDDFESKYSFHPLEDFPAPEEYRHFTKIYPSKTNRVMRGAPPLPPVAR
ncbi:hypothetical protein MATL_G00211970 [Megalops atlanticus]|uniref:WH2 domain-containing protein n=1 Tax=Megalops atlanticus TaxID=7932 RepID=A0A9D3PFZ0_MEGAT|nr:hypothetical protein MATL_G00211970 [Megalops atlanticus]